jgi:hypothetical protein
MKTHVAPAPAAATRARSRALVSALGLVAAAVASAPAPASAAPLGLSSLPAMPALGPLKDGPPAGVKLEVSTGYAGRTWHRIDAEAAKGYCIMTGGSSSMTTQSWNSAIDESDQAYVVRLVEKDGQARLEVARLAFDAVAGSASGSAPKRVALREIARSGDVVAWAYREGKRVVVVSRRITGGVDTASSKLEPEREGEDVSPFLANDGCPFVLARLDLRAAGPIAQLEGAISKGKGKARKTRRYVIDVSVSKVARDPEPLVSARVRDLEKHQDR